MSLLLSVVRKLQMNRVVLDASAVLAFLFQEKGGDKVEALLAGSLLSVVNYAEVITKLYDRGMSVHDAKSLIGNTDIELVEFNSEQAFIVGDLRKSTRHLGLSLGDRACIALAKLKGLQVVTADTAWADLADFNIILIRERKPN
jgi:ribonuclease VapC